ncbi:tetratricopeptide repeat protein [Anabaenopsis elenkinii]|uniref:Tetratricopeptide repeat protein n=1 Tax=Anabaenopsis elenkinii CCIBt3563 TaxID=2779889 RepID=A0A7S6U2X5_9CYAN|nr:hypothetical protein [Anabaenopsis elenkinii]QOV23590.1 hypothetical protein IM676_04615 [Anabaenopsis elenkinii CCIBt3563]
MADYTQAITLNLNDALAYGVRGIIYRQPGDINKAKEDLQRAAQLFRNQGNTAAYQDVIEILNSL